MGVEHEVVSLDDRPGVLLSVAEVAARLGVDVQTVRRYIHSGDLVAVRLGGSPKSHYRVTPRALDAFLKHPEEVA